MTPLDDTETSHERAGTVHTNRCVRVHIPVIMTFV